MKSGRNVLQLIYNVQESRYKRFSRNVRKQKTTLVIVVYTIVILKDDDDDDKSNNNHCNKNKSLCVCVCVYVFQTIVWKRVLVDRQKQLI